MCGFRLLAAASTTFEAAASWWGLVAGRPSEAGRCGAVGIRCGPVAGPGRRPRGRVSGRVCGRRSRSPSCGVDLDALVVRPGRLAVQRRQARRSARHAPQLLQVVVVLLAGQPRAGGRHGGRAGLGQGAEDPGPYRVQGRLGRAGFSITASSSTAPESLRQKKLSRREMLSVRIGGGQGGRGNRRTLGNGLASRRRWVPNASARKSHEAGLLSACDPRLVRSSARAARAVGAPLRAV